ncbi:hypothetical protein PIIN_05815 [Serendipita indica DSM 11827]|uniref:DUF8191 domain-containing protein n=1 Tax=Serendipita indica (strain DSM 11827) TaxID=1109443 RepID=G4TKN4_SERID|nr:hypothetical protein PIIN_05815 [Serendipita indica DSM 11827]
MGCFKCLYNWFLSRPPAEGTTTFPDPYAFRTNTCPQCRTSVRVSPIPSFLLKNLIGEMRSAGLLEPTSPTVPASDSRTGLPNGARISTEMSTVFGGGGEVGEEEEHEAAIGFSDSDSSVDDTGFQARREHSNHLMQWELDFRNDHAGSWVSPRWETPRFTVDSSALSTSDIAELGLPQREVHALLRRGASKDMIRLYQMRFQREHGITANSGSVSVRLGWNLARNAMDVDGSAFMQATMDEMRTHRERYSSSRAGRMGSATIFLNSTLKESSLNRGDVIEIQGPSGSGKTELLYYLAMTTILPHNVQLTLREGHLELDVGAREKSVVVCDCDGQWNISRFHKILKQLLWQRVEDACPDSVSADQSQIEAQLEEVVVEALRRLHIFRPTSSASLAATLLMLPRYHFENMRYEELCMLMIDGGLSSFYWQDRYVDELGRQPGDPVSTATTGVIRALSSFRQVHDAIIIFTNWAISPLSNSTFFKQHLPPPWPSPFELGPNGESQPRISPIEVTHHITLRDPNHSPASDHELLPEVGLVRIEGVVRTPPRDLPETIVTHFEFHVGDSGLTVLPIEEVAEGEGTIEED